MKNLYLLYKQSFDTMQLTIAFLRLIRIVNILIIGVTQWIFYIAVVRPDLPLETIRNSNLVCYTIIAASICIAAAGYLINDYFDLQIDQYNKPNRVIIGKYFSKRVVMVWHGFFTILGLLFSYFAFKATNNYFLLAGNTIAAILLWFYSSTFKRQAIFGNLVISFLAAWTILVLLTAFYPIFFESGIKYLQLTARLSRIALLYAGFSFIVTLIREVIKDMEDVEGDKKFKCTTLPIAFGNRAAKVFALNWQVMLIVLCIITITYTLQFRWFIFSTYLFFMVLVPSIFIFRKIMQSSKKEDFAQISRYLKWIMVAGIGSLPLILLHKA